MGYYEKIKDELLNLVSSFNSASRQFDEKMQSLKQGEASLRKEELRINLQKEEVKQMALERQKGFPILAKAYDEYFALQDKSLIDFLRYKEKPAPSASDIVKEYSKTKREALKNKKILQLIVDYYEFICPFLVELKEEEFSDIKEEDTKYFVEYSEEEREDEVTLYLTKEEYRKLSVGERNQLALDRYWKRPKSKWHIGKLYERYVGYLFEKEGYKVDYIGITKGLEDLGRDIIATNKNEVVIIQCKNWSKFRTIYEKHIFQFFGTVFQYKDEHHGEKVRAMFYTTTKLSDLARRFGKELGIEMKEEFKFDSSYPCIKCNINQSTKEKIYHLPFDQQYDKTKIIPSLGELYCSTVKEAEEAGFRRAFRWHSNNTQSHE